jgi:hypothetical protein
MTEQEYKVLQAWCKSAFNKKHYPNKYKEMVSIRNKATQIRRNIILCREYIKDAMFVLEASKTPEAIAKWKGIVLTHQECKRGWMEQFKNL